MINHATLSTLLSLFAGLCVAQPVPGPVIGSVGYKYPTPAYFAPGQLVTVFVDGIESPPRKRVPTETDLPTSLEGISASVVQVWDSRLLTWRLPILEARWFHSCSAPTAFVCYTPTAAITLQIPFEMQVLLERCPTCFAGQANLSVSVHEDGYVPLEVLPVPDAVRIVRVFDSVLPIQKREPIGWCSPLSEYMNTAPYNLTGLPCPSIVRHKDGSLVLATNPARAGEELVAWAVGLGRTVPESETGKIVKASAPTVTTFALDFNYRRNALPTRPPPAGGDIDVPVAIYTGTVEGEVGIYQIKFQVPPVPAGTPSCTARDNRTFPQGNVVYSNLTVSVGGMSSFDGAGICVVVDD